MINMINKITKNSRHEIKTIKNPTQLFLNNYLHTTTATTIMIVKFKLTKYV